MSHSPLALLRVVIGAETQAVVGIPADIGVYRPLIFLDIAPDYSIVAALYAMDIELPCQFELRLVILCDQQQARGVLVYSVNQDSHPFILCIRALAYSKMVGQGVDERPLEMAVTRVDDHPGRLVDHQHVVILVDYVQRYILREYFQTSAAVGHYEADYIARTDYVIGFHEFVAYVHIAFPDGQLDAMTGSVLHVLSHVLVYSYGRLPDVHIEPEMLEHLRFFAFGKFQGFLFDFGVEFFLSPFVSHCTAPPCSALQLPEVW